MLAISNYIKSNLVEHWRQLMVGWFFSIIMMIIFYKLTIVINLNNGNCIKQNSTKTMIYCSLVNNKVKNMGCQGYVVIQQLLKQNV